jgi:septum site-determining protein MinD
MGDSKVFGIVALKGGVGKTTVVANLGAALTDTFKKKVLLVDANFSTPHLGMHVGLVNPEYTLHHVLNNKNPIYESIYQHNIGFHIIPGKISPFEVDPFILKEKLEPLRDIYDVILIDSSPSLNEEMFATMAASDELLVVSSPDYPTLSSTLYAINVARQRETPIRGIVINKVRRKRFELTSKDIANASDVKVLATIPDNVKVLSALSRMIPVVIDSPKQDVSLAYTKLAGSLIGEPVKSSYLSRFIRRKKEVETE